MDYSHFNKDRSGLSGAGFFFLKRLKKKFLATGEKEK